MRDVNQRPVDNDPVQDKAVEMVIQLGREQANHVLETSLIVGHVTGQRFPTKDMNVLEASILYSQAYCIHTTAFILARMLASDFQASTIAGWNKEDSEASLTRHLNLFATLFTSAFEPEKVSIGVSFMLKLHDKEVTH